MTILHVYHATLPSVNYVFPNGKPAIFILGRYTTDVQWEIEHLDLEIKNGHPHIHTKPGEETMDSKYLDPMHAVREKVLAEAVAAGIVYMNPARDMGTTTQGKLNIQTSADVSQAAAGGSGTPSGASLLNLQQLLNKPTPLEGA